MKELYKGQRIALHVLDEHILPLMPTPIPMGGTQAAWDTYWEKCAEILGPEYDPSEAEEFGGYFTTTVEELVGDQVLFRDSYGELRLVPFDWVITEQEAPKAFKAWLSQERDKPWMT